MRRKHGTKSAGPTETAAFELGARYTEFKNDLIAFAAKESDSYTFAAIASRMENLFHAEAIREQLRTGEQLPQMSQNGSSNHSGRPEESGYDDLEPAPALPAGTPGNRPLKLNRLGNRTGFHSVSEAGRRNIGQAQRLRWQKYHEKQKAKKARVKGSPRYEAQRIHSKQSKGAKAYWAQFTDAEKSEIMKARKAVAAEKKKASL